MATKFYQVESFRGVSLLLASASLITGSPTLIDRVANALTMDSVIKSINDALRVVESFQKNSSEVNGITETQDRKTILKVDGKTFIFPATLSSTRQVQDFFIEAEKDIRIARAVAALAEGLIVDSRRSGKEGEN
jgi:CRISPR type I-A-associated protein Csa5